jgi:LysR family transcriptional regulator, hydrogen peroxide-inducible genes activator
MPINVISLTLRDLEYLVTVGELLHFGKAALKCHVSQPALSGQIKKIEDLLGVRVFERTKRRVAKSAMGEEIIAQAQIILSEARKLENIVRGNSAPLSGEFRLGAIATVGPYYIPHLLAPLRKAYPSLQLQLVEGLTDNLVDRLRTGGLDAILASPTFNERGLRLIPLFFESFYLLAPTSHPLSGLEAVRSSDLRASEMVLLEDGHCLKDQALQICPTNRRGSVRQFHATSLETLKALVATGFGYTLIPSLAAQPDPRYKGLVKYRKIEGKAVGRQIALVCRENYARMRDVEELAQWIRQHLPKELDPIELP